MSKQTKSQRIRNLLAQGKSVKEICKAVKCAPGRVYQVKSYDKSKAVKAKKVAKKDWVMVTTSRSNEPIGIPRDVYEAHQPRDYYQPKPSLFQRVKNFFLGV